MGKTCKEQAKFGVNSPLSPPTPRISVNVVGLAADKAVYANLTNKTNGIWANISVDFVYAIAPFLDKLDAEKVGGYLVRLSSFEVVELAADPRLGDKTVDSDNDDLSDLAELIKEESRLIYVGNTSYNVNVWTFKSNPAVEDSDGDGIWDDEDAQPLKPFDERFKRVGSIYYIPSFSNINDTKNKSDKSYNSNSPIPFSNDYFRLGNILARAKDNVFFSVFLDLKNAKKFLNHFLDNTGALYEFDATEVIEKTENGNKNFSKNINGVLKLCEETVKSGSSMLFSSSNQSPLIGTEFSSISHDFSKLLAEKETFDWWFSIGDSCCGITLQCYNNNGVYTAQIKYYIFDFYNWVKDSNAGGGIVTDGEMCELHEAGWAREFQALGSYNYKITWNLGERLNEN